ncbi:hypothetical protein EJ08DRAFT_683800 [Tothia fuscella]|uniref:SUN domain-containing protein n=1 Tax=Tothia fuscella TaxID=1048955 RepID=A0A9P4TS06_9PEZI|nr:hypothetical protein EJ08DRAFT_683800 [Tothia fuscella]
MLKIGRFNVSTRILLLLSCLAGADANSTNATTSTIISSSAATVKPSTSIPFALIHIASVVTTSTCPARTVNYVTHILPQQCLRTSRSATRNSTTATATTISSDGVNSTTSTASTGPSTGTAALSRESSSTIVTPTESLSANKGSATELSVKLDSSASPTSATEPDPASFDPSSIASAATERETDSPLDDVKFVSFEEWKKQNLAKVGQSPENVGKGRPIVGDGQRRPAINNALDSLGDDAEIELDFSGFGAGEETPTSLSPNTRSSQTTSETPATSESLTASVARPRNKDAGKTCKERFNYASFDCAATVLKTNPQCKSSSSVLVENKDSYMLNECGAKNKFIIVEMCDDILVDTIVLANFEFFSSQFRTFRVSVSDRYPVKLDRWKDLGTFEARNSREIQAFLVQNPLIWARYLRIEFLTHYGAEFFCPLSLVRVHGTTMMEEFRHQEEAARGEDDIEDDVAGIVPEDTQVNTLQAQTPIETVPVTPEPALAEKTISPEPISTEQVKSTLQSGLLSLASNTTNTIVDTISSTNSTKSTVTTPGERSSLSGTKKSQVSAPALQATSVANNTVSSSTRSISHPALRSLSDSPQPSLQTSTQIVQGPEPSPTNLPSVSSTKSSTATTEQKLSSSSSPSFSSSVVVQPGVKLESKLAQAPSEAVKPPTSTTQQHPPTPTTQESFFKSVHKRLQMLESNSTLSLQYIEEQSRILRDAFLQVEKRQLGKTETFLNTLNDSVLTELRWFRTQYDQLWQSTVIELETHQQQYQREMLAVSSRLTIMADELVFQKRMIVMQSTLLLICLGLVIFVRSGSGYLELPLMQNVMNKSRNSMLRLSFESPSGSPSSRESSPEIRKTRRLVRHGSGTSEGSLGSPLIDQTNLNPSLQFSSPTPSEGRSERSPSPAIEVKGEGRPENPAPVRQTKSGPATPSGTRENQNPLEWVDARSDSPIETSLQNGVHFSADTNGDNYNHLGQYTPADVHRLSTVAGTSQSHPMRQSSRTSLGASPLRYSSEYDEGERNRDGMTDRAVVATSGKRDVPLNGYSGVRGGASGGSSDDGDTAAEMFIADGLDSD